MERPQDLVLNSKHTKERKTEIRREVRKNFWGEEDRDIEYAPYGNLWEESSSGKGGKIKKERKK